VPSVDTYRSDEEIERKSRRGHDRLLEHIDDERIMAYVRETGLDPEE
jgi:hypothetical protein